MPDLNKSVWEALTTVIDPEINRPITELNMIDNLTVTDDGDVEVTILLTIAGCPLSNTIENDAKTAIEQVPGVKSVKVHMGAMTDQQRKELTTKLRGDKPENQIIFNKPGSMTRVIVVASGKGGVGKSSVTVNLALALARLGRKVGLLDADIYGHSVPDLMGITDARPTVMDNMIMPVPVRMEATDGVEAQVQVISMGMLKERRDQVIAWRGPILDRAITQLLADVFWGDLDYFLIDLPPGTGDVAMTIGQKLPGSEMVVVTTPQSSVAEVSERAGTMGSMLNQNALGVIENMSWLETTCPHCNEPFKLELYGSGGGAQVSDALTDKFAKPVPLLAQIPMDQLVALGGEKGTPIVMGAPDRPAGAAFIELAKQIAKTKKSIVGKPLNLGVQN
ncbi:Mrp/NBP35 family ATP-binding protein [Propionimicrobium lymphophilum]|uniref:Mrp/NBP35 family ATP-binding protein n=1 Tax=Propionimicrobium lymphophilum TaxID=33012 RepID=UPI0023F2D8B4|nr:Mrp/NBP35 family ATP-binding protein [Propionimicrobium lymphophilum]MDK7709637.1 Mrp/NBP35 family ATP-binding protein [Propionimicrobium lymphophilum]MDK7733622.1 Mrp/NBP35 family ATP-binding protein [Propionimicrobium lymphophilum]